MRNTYRILLFVVAFSFVTALPAMDMASFNAWYVSHKFVSDTNTLFAQDPERFVESYVKHRIERGDYTADQPNLDVIKKKLLRIFTILYEYTANSKRIFKSLDELRDLAEDKSVDFVARINLLFPLYVESDDTDYACRAIEATQDAYSLFEVVKDKNFDHIMRQLLAKSFTETINNNVAVASRVTLIAISPGLLRAARFQGDYQQMASLLIDNYYFLASHSSVGTVEFAKELRNISQSDFDHFLVTLCNDDGGPGNLILNNLVMQGVTTKDGLRTLLENDSRSRVRRINDLSDPSAADSNRK
jgi:hypothetical protein